jgi:hypothetical protein
MGQKVFSFRTQKELTIKEADESPQQKQQKVVERSACKTFCSTLYV